MHELKNWGLEIKTQKHLGNNSKVGKSLQIFLDHIDTPAIMNADCIKNHLKLLEKISNEPESNDLKLFELRKIKNLTF